MTVYAVAIHGTYLSQQVVHQRYYESEGASASFQEFADLLGQELETAVAPAVNTSMTYTHLVIRPVTEGSIGSTVIPAGWPFSGTNAGNPLPSFVTARLKLFAAGTQHPVRGMVQLSGLPEEGTTGNQIAANHIAAVSTAAEAFASTIQLSGSENWVPVLWSDQYQRSAPVTGYLAAAQLGTQRRRMTGAGS